MHTEGVGDTWSCKGVTSMITYASYLGPGGSEAAQPEAWVGSKLVRCSYSYI